MRQDFLPLAYMDARQDRARPETRTGRRGPIAACEHKVYHCNGILLNSHNSINTLELSLIPHIICG